MRDTDRPRHRQDRPARVSSRYRPRYWEHPEAEEVDQNIMSEGNHFRAPPSSMPSTLWIGVRFRYGRDAEM